MDSKPAALGAYVQVPFCQTKCTYCNFHTGVVSPQRYAPYAAAVCREILETAAELRASKQKPQVIDTVYFGGGTPSLLEPRALSSILEALSREFGFAQNSDGAALEITLEADPETITTGKAAAWLDAGFSRISLGVQSFNDVELKAAGRMHRRTDIFNAAQTLRAAGFRNISMDLIAGLAHQTPASWAESVARLADIRPEHVSIYILEIDDGSNLGRESLAGGQRYSAGSIPDDDAIADSYEQARTALRSAGYEHYEISNWGLPGFRSRHNLKYWRRESYLGFGAGAHSFDGTKRWANLHDSARYAANIEQGISTREQEQDVTLDAALEEELFLGLRQLDGIDLAAIEASYRVDLSARVKTLREQGLVETAGTRLRLASDRLSVSNGVLVELLS